MKKSLVIMALISLMNSAFALDCSNEFVQSISNQIDTYLDRYPHAVDTAEGVHYFWIDWGNEPVWPLDFTKTSLNCLESEGKVHSIKLGSKILWRR